MFENALDTHKDGADLAAGLTTGSNAGSTAETEQSGSGNELTFTAGNSKITSIKFGATSGIAVSGTDGTPIFWAVNNSGQLVGHIGSSSGPIGIILSISGATTAKAGHTAAPTITATLTDNFPHAAGAGDIEVNGINIVATDKNHLHATGNVDVHIVDDVPTAHDDGTFSVAEGGSVNIDVFSNDVAGADGVNLTTGLTLVTGPSHGSLVYNDDGTFTYQANGTAGADSFVYQIKDADGDVSQATATINVAGPSIEVDKSAGSATIDEGGASVTYTYDVTNTGASTDPVTLTSLVDDNGTPGITGDDVDLLAHGTFVGGDTNHNGQIDTGEVWEYTYTTTVTANAGQSVTNTVTAAATDEGNNTTTATDTATVTADDVKPSIEVEKSADPTSINSGGEVTYTYDVTNTGASTDPLTLTVLVDDKGTPNDTSDDVDLLTDFAAGSSHGDFYVSGDSNNDYKIDAGETWIFQDTIDVTGASGSVTNTVTATATDDEQNSVTDTATATVTVLNAVPTAGEQSIVIDEDGLPGGNAGNGTNTTGDVPGQTITVSDVLAHDFGPDGAAATDPITFAALNGHSVTDTSSTAVTSGGQALTYFWDSTNDVLYASTNADNLADAQSTAAFKVVLNTSTGAYTYTELKPLDHHVAGVEDNINIDLSYQVKDSNGDTANGTLHVAVNDDSPDASNDTATVSPASGKNDLVLVVDVSESMNDTVSGVSSDFGFGNTRLDLARLALLQLINDSNTDEVKFVLFRGSDKMTVWMDKSDALAYVANASNFDNSNLGSGTNYDAALGDNGSGSDKGAEHAFDTQPLTPDDTRLVYFLSDGDPTEGGAAGGGFSGSGISTTEETGWINYLSANDVSQVTAVGFGDVTQPNNLEPIAWVPGEATSTNTTAAQDHNVITVSNTDLSQLGTILVGTVPNSTSGNVITVDSGQGTDSFGADGGHIVSITIGGTTYSWDGNNTIDPGTPGNPGDDITGSSLADIPTPDGGSLTFDFKTGAWTYTSPASVASAMDETFAYTIVDGDGDKANATLTVHLVPVTSQPQIFTAVDHPYWTADTSSSGTHDNNQDFINRVAFFDADQPATVSVTFASLNSGDAFNEIGTFANVSVSGNGTSSITLTGSIADINRFLADDHLGWNPSGSDSTGNDQVDRVVTVTVDDHAGNTTTDAILLDHQTPSTSSGNNTVDLSNFNIDEGTLSLGGGSDTAVTATAHGPSTGDVTYDGGTNSGTTDTITLVFTPDQLESLLSDISVGGTESALQSYLDGSVTGSTLNLGGSVWNAVVQNFENAHLAVAAGNDGYVVDSAIDTSGGANLPDLISGSTGTNSDNTLVGSASDDTLTGGGTSNSNESAADGNDILVGLGGNDTLWGGGGRDILLGGAGNDNLHGGDGVDILSGGAGADTFFFSAADAESDGVPTTNADHIVDYSFMEGDVIDLSSLIAGFGGAGGSNVGDFVRLVKTPGDSTSLTLQVDANGAAGGHNFVDVAELDHYRETSADVVEVQFNDSSNHSHQYLITV